MQRIDEINIINIEIYIKNEKNKFKTYEYV